MMKRFTIQFEKGGKHNCILHSESCEKSGHDQLGDSTEQLCRKQAEEIFR